MIVALWLLSTVHQGLEQLRMSLIRPMRTFCSGKRSSVSEDGAWPGWASSSPWWAGQWRSLQRSTQRPGSRLTMPRPRFRTSPSREARYLLGPSSHSSLPDRSLSAPPDRSMSSMNHNTKFWSAYPMASSAMSPVTEPQVSRATEGRRPKPSFHRFPPCRSPRTAISTSPMGHEYGSWSRTARSTPLQATVALAQPWPAALRRSRRHSAELSPSRSAPVVSFTLQRAPRSSVFRQLAR